MVKARNSEEQPRSRSGFMEKHTKGHRYHKYIQHGVYLTIILTIVLAGCHAILLQNSRKWSVVAFKWYIHNNGIIYYKTNRKFEMSGENLDIYLSHMKINSEENQARRYLDDLYDSMGSYDRAKVHLVGYSNQDLNKLQSYLNEMRSRDAMKSISDGATAPAWR